MGQWRIDRVGNAVDAIAYGTQCTGAAAVRGGLKCEVQMIVEFQRGKMLLTAENYLEGAFMRDEMGVKSGSVALYVTGDASSGTSR